MPIQLFLLPQILDLLLVQKAFQLVAWVLNVTIAFESNSQYLCRQCRCFRLGCFIYFKRDFPNNNKPFVNVSAIQCLCISTCKQQITDTSSPTEERRFRQIYGVTLAVWSAI